MQGKVALVTGGGRGIGAATCKLLASKGAKVVVNFAHNEEAARAVVREISDTGGDATLIQADVRDNAQVTSMMKSIVETWGTVDILVNKVYHWNLRSRQRGDVDGLTLDDCEPPQSELTGGGEFEIGFSGSSKTVGNTPSAILRAASGFATRFAR